MSYLATSLPLRVAGLPSDGPTAFHLEPDAEARAAIAVEMGIDAVRKLRFSGAITAEPGGAWALRGDLGATVVQPCVVTLQPVTTRIDAPVLRRFVPDMAPPEPGADAVEMDPDDTLEPLGPVIDPGAVMVEALALALPLYPRRPEAGPGDILHAAPGVTPLTDAAARPLAGLADLRDRLAAAAGDDADDADNARDANTDAATDRGEDVPRATGPGGVSGDDSGDTNPDDTGDTGRAPGGDPGRRGGG